MPEPIPDPISDDESRRLLREFLRQVEKLFGDLAQNPGRALPGRHHESMSAAWESVKPEFNIAINALQPPDPNTIVTQLKQRGLTGPQLVFKLAVFRHAREKLMDHGTPKAGQEKGRGWWARFRGFFTSTLKAADVILGSLAEVIPVVGAIKEFKESVESAVELGEADK
jgi:hypothetical protein